MADLEAVSELLKRFDPIRVAWVFGSAAEETLTKTSDLDVAVLGDEPLRASFKKELISELGRAFGRPIDLVDLQARGGPIMGQVLHRGEMLFCRDRHLYAELMKRWMFDQADWMPIRKRILETRRSKWLDPS